MEKVEKIDIKYINIIESIASVAIFQVEGVASLTNEAGMSSSQILGYIKKGKNSITAYFSESEVVIDLFINAYNNYSIPILAFNIQEKVKEEVEKSTNYKVKQINVNVVGIVFAEK